MNEARARQALLARLGEIAQEDRISEEGRAPVRLAQDSVGRLSRMDAMQQQAMAQAQERRRIQEKSRIAAALARMDEGEWGFCIQCGDSIAPKRLVHDPSVAVCFECASAEGD